LLGDRGRRRGENGERHYSQFFHRRKPGNNKTAPDPEGTPVAALIGATTVRE